MNFSTTETEQHSTTTTQTWSWSTTIPIPAHTRVDAAVIVEEAQYSLGFTSKARYSGSVVFVWDLDLSNLPGGTHSHEVFSQPLGILFINDPHPGITVIDNETIELQVTGVFTGEMGLKYNDANPATKLKRTG
jgi:Clostridium epsilon toxin ETX/Bacillus mosquitocidal toxin MTX2